MRFQRDYILRMIEMMGDLFRRVGEMLDDFEKTKELDRISKEYCGMSLDAALGLDNATLNELLAPQSRFILSELIYIQARTSHRLLQEDIQQLIAHAAKLLISLWDDSLICELRNQRLVEMIDLYNLPLSGDDHLCAARFFSTAEVFDKVEDEIFNAASTAADRHAIIIEGKSLFSQISRLSDEKLILGNLPREELETAMADLAALDISS
jgi:hypothetical protein